MKSLAAIDRAPGVFCIVVTLCLGCSETIRVAAETNPSTDFGALRTYAWRVQEPRIIAPALPPKTAESLDTRVRAAVDTQLAAKGYGRISMGKPDFLVDYRMEFKIKSANSFQEYYRYWRQGGWQGPSEAFVFGYEAGMLTVALTDPRTEQPIWRGTAERVVSPEVNQAILDQTVARLFEKLP